MSRSGVSPLDDQWTHVVSGLLVVFGVSAIAVGELSIHHKKSVTKPKLYQTLQRLWLSLVDLAH